MLCIARKCRALPLSFHLSPPNPPFPPPQPPSSPTLHAAENTILSFLRSFSSQPSSSNSRSSPAPFVRGGFYDSDDSSRCHPSLPLCPGCGVHMQDSDPSLPGFFSLPSAKSPDYHSPIAALPLSFSFDSQASVSLKSGLLQELPENSLREVSGAGSRNLLVCARCHSLRHYGRVKLTSAENLLPSFDFDCLIAPKMASPSGPRSVVLFVVDAADFEGSFPRKTARILSSCIERNARAWKESKPANVPRIILVVSKLDLLPPSMSPEKIGRWMRQRANDLGAVKLSGLHLVSAAKDFGVRKLVEQVAEFAGQRGNVWAVGAQNAGKSTLINAMARCVGRKMAQLTEAPVPGTTLGIVRVEGVLCGQTKLFDTPGILHPYQITTRLTPEEHRLVHIRKELKPMTYRIKAGHSIHIGGLMRLDVEKSSADTIYITVWASPLLPLHMGKKENSYKMIEDHFGRQLQPPIGVNRISELGKWVRTEFRVIGDSWEESSTDIATAGLGWAAICLKGEAVLGVWTYDGIEVVSRSSLIMERAKLFEEAGFSVSKIVSQADRFFSKEKRIKSVNIQNKVKPAASSNCRHLTLS